MVESQLREETTLELDGATLGAELIVPVGAHGVVVFAHGSGSSRHSPRNKAVAAELRRAGLGTLLMDLLTPAEEAAEARSGHLRFDIDLLASRLVGAIDWLAGRPDTAATPADASSIGATSVGALPIGAFGASTGAAAAIVAAAERPARVRAVVSRGGRPDLAGPALARIRCPLLLIVGGRDEYVLTLNRQALATVTVERRLEVIGEATHLFEEPGAIEEVSVLARTWFDRHLRDAVVSLQT